MARAWYVLQTYTGYESKVERELNVALNTNEIDKAALLTIKVPQEEVDSVSKTGKHYKRASKLLPGYVLLEMDISELNFKAVCSSIRRIQGVTGFVGTKSNEKPRPISTEEVKHLLQKTGEIKGEKATRLRYVFTSGDKVKICDGPFSGFTGTVDEVRAEQEKLRVNVEIFGRATPVELSYTQVERA